jgi:tetratricopeptide (TPR) repeat protein
LISEEENFRRGLSLLAEGRYDQAIGCLGQVSCSPGPTGLLSRYYQGKAWFAMAADLARAGDLAQSRKALLAAARLIGRYVDLAWYLARAQMPQIAADGEEAATHRRLGLKHVQAGDHRLAVQELDLAYSLGLHDVMSAYELVCTAHAAAETAGTPLLRLQASTVCGNAPAVSKLAEMVTAEHEFVAAMLCLPTSSADNEVFGLMADVLAVAIERHEPYADLHNARSQVLARLGRTDEAIRHAARAAEINPKYVQARIHFGRLLTARDPASAIAQFQQAAAAGGDYADVHMAMADIYEQMGQLEQARRSLRRAIEINGDYTQAKDALARLAA